MNLLKRLPCVPWVLLSFLFAIPAFFIGSDLVWVFVVLQWTSLLVAVIILVKDMRKRKPRRL